LWHPLGPPLDEIQCQSDGKDCKLSNQEFFPIPCRQKPLIASLGNRRVDMPKPPDDSTRTACDKFLNRIEDENHPVRDEKPQKTAPKQLKDYLERFHRRLPFAIYMIRHQLAEDWST
jgi:hypothetical protein